MFLEFLKKLLKKVQSRKFLLGLTGAITGLILAFKGSAETAETVTGIIMATASIVAYIFGEGLVDSSYNQSNTTNKEVTVTSYVDGNEGDIFTTNVTEEDVASIAKMKKTIVPKTTGRDGITIDGNEDI